MNDEAPGSRLGKGLQVSVWFNDHQMSYQWDSNDPVQSGNHAGSEGDVWDEVSIHNINLKAISASIFSLPCLFAKTRKVSAQDRGFNQHHVGSSVSMTSVVF